MVWNVTKDGIRERMAVVDEHTWNPPLAYPAKPVSAADRVGYSPEIEAGRLDMSEVLKAIYQEASDAVGRKFGRSWCSLRPARRASVGSLVTKPEPLREASPESRTDCPEIPGRWRQSCRPVRAQLGCAAAETRRGDGPSRDRRHVSIRAGDLPPRPLHVRVVGPLAALRRRPRDHVGLRDDRWPHGPADPHGRRLDDPDQRERLAALR